MKDYEVLEVGGRDVYHLVNGVSIYSKHVMDDERGNLIFDMKESVVLIQVMSPRGDRGVNVVKGTDCDITMWARRYEVRKEAVVARGDVGNEALMNNIRQVLTGLILAKPGR